MALLNVAMADGGIAVWDAKFTYWYPRPDNGDPRLRRSTRTGTPSWADPALPGLPLGQRRLRAAAPRPS